MSALEPGMARISHPDSGVEDAVVPAAAVPHWEYAGWKYEEGDREDWPTELQRFEGQTQVRIYHPDLDVYETVAESAVPHHRSRGWTLAADHDAEQLETKKVAELRQLAKDRGISPIPSTKDELVAALEQQNTQDDAGDVPAPDSEEREQ